MKHIFEVLAAVCAVVAVYGIILALCNAAAKKPPKPARNYRNGGPFSL